MFAKAKNETLPTAPSYWKSATAQPSLLAPGLRIVGDIHSDGNIQIDGRIDGDIRSATLTIGEGAVVNGAIRAGDVCISGVVNGEIAAPRVRLTATARVTGDINHRTLTVESGARIEGACRRMEEATLALKQTAAAEN